MTAYAELQVTTNFTFLRGASHPDELAERAKRLGLAAMGVTDRNSLAGVARAHVAAKEVGLPLVVGARLDLEDGFSVLVWPEDRPAYARLSSLLTLGKRRAAKGACSLWAKDLLAAREGLVIALLEPEKGEPAADSADFLRAIAPERRHVAASYRFDGADRPRIEGLQGFANAVGARLLATGAVEYHEAARKPLQDVLFCIREGARIDEAGALLEPAATRALAAPAAMIRRFAPWPDAIRAGLAIAARCRFSLDELAYDYPIEADYGGLTPQEELARRAWAGAVWRYGADVPEKARKLLEHELRLIEELSYAPYFLTVDDIVRFARAKGILAQGRGSAANSCVCYCLGVTSVDPAQMDLLFERFVSAERDEPPDIDVDFEHERREEVIQHIYARYGRDHAALAATVVRYRAKSAAREVGKVFGLGADSLDVLSKTIWGYGREGYHEERIKKAGIDPEESRVRQVLDLAGELLDFPRHLSQHVGGFVIAKSPLRELVPIENAAMEDRTVVSWDKDDLEALKMLKIDILGLGMLSCIRRGFELLRAHKALDVDLASVPAELPEVYDMLCDADTIGVFQIESRAQMSMLPRLRPRRFYDLVVEVAIVRPGPIQGDMVHPYLRRRSGEEAVEFPSQELEDVLGKTLGVPLFQEQAMKIAIVAAGFSPSEADGLRRAMATFKRKGKLEHYHAKMIEGMTAKGYDPDFAERCFKQIEGFGYYGFPESHAASFALLVYVSAWLKQAHPEIFCCAILNSQPMGFYAPAQLVRDARDHGVEVRGVDVGHSDWESALEDAGGGRFAVRLGLDRIKGMKREDAERIVAARADAAFRDLEDVKRRAALSSSAMRRLADADAFASLGQERRRAGWNARALKDSPLPLFEHAEAARNPLRNAPPVDRADGDEAPLPEASRGEGVIADFAMTGLSLDAHPCALLRPALRRDGVSLARELMSAPNGAWLAVVGLVLVRQRPGSANGVCFLTLEDETGFANCVLWPKRFEALRAPLMTARLARAQGQVQREGQVVHLVLSDLEDASHLLSALAAGQPAEPVLPKGRNFH